MIPCLRRIQDPKYSTISKNTNQILQRSSKNVPLSSGPKENRTHRIYILVIKVVDKQCDGGNSRL